MLKILNRVASGIIFLTLITLTFKNSGEGFGIIIVGVKLLIPMVCIWFGYQLTEEIGGSFMPPNNHNIVGILVTMIGWVILVGPPIFSYIT